MSCLISTSIATASLPETYSNHPPTTKQQSSLPQHITIIKAWRHGETNANKENLLSGGGSDDPLKKTALNDKGRSQAEQLGKLVVQSGALDIIYSSDLSRALDTAAGVLRAFDEIGAPVELRTSMQLREIFHGQLELTDAQIRNEAGIARFHDMLKLDQEQKTSEIELNDKFRFWKIHPQVADNEIVPEDVVNAEDYIKRGETRPETPFKYWKRIYSEFQRIAKENPGRIVGISMHGAGLGTLVEGLNPQPKGNFLPPHYSAKEIKVGDKVIIPAASKIENCDLIHFKFNSRNGNLEIYDPEKTRDLTPHSESLEELSHLPISDEKVQRTFLVRHGESTANVYFEHNGKKVRYVSGQSANVPLTDHGKKQILELAEKLSKRLPINARLVLVSSPAARTQGTAKIIFEELSKTHSNVILAEEVYEGLHERHLGDWEGLIKDEKYSEAEASWKKLSAADKFHTPEVEGGESNAQVADRASSAMEKIYQKYAGATVLAVTSFNTINSAAMHINDRELELPTKAGTNLPKINLANGDLVLFETDRTQGFACTQAMSHLKHGKPE